MDTKQTLVMQAPIGVRAGYGDHSRDLLYALYKMDKYDVKIIPMRWGNCPQDQLTDTTDFGRWVLQSMIFELNYKPDVFIQISVANEFEPKGNYNIGITAGVETNLAPADFIIGSNKMDLIIVPSKFTKDVLVTTLYQQIDKNTNQQVGEIRLTKPVEILFEGVDTEIYQTNFVLETLNDIPEDFAFLSVGHWLRGDIAQDRKDIGMTVKTFAATFRTLPKNKRPALILKTSFAGFSEVTRYEIEKRINAILEPFGKDKPSVYLLLGDLTPNEMASLYNHPKVKAMVSFTKGEGYGRPLAEFALTGKPIVVSKWSGLVDFLPEANTVYLDGKLGNVHESAADQFLMKEAQWFNVDYTDASNKLFDIYKKYDIYLKNAAGLKSNILKNFTLEKMISDFEEILVKYVKEKPKIVPFTLPKLTKIK